MLFEIIICYKDRTWTTVKRDHPEHFAGPEVLGAFMDEIYKGEIDEVKKDIMYIDIYKTYDYDEDDEDDEDEDEDE